MNERQLYHIRPTGNPSFNYYFDKFVGFFINSRERDLSNPQKVLFIRNDHIGDMVYSTQIFREFKKNFPNSKIYVLANSGNSDLIRKDNNVYEIIESDRWWNNGFRGLIDYYKTYKKIRKEKFDVGVDLRRSKLNMFFYLFLPRVSSRVSFYNINGGKPFLTNPVICDEGEIYIREITNMINKAFNLNIDNFWPSIETDLEDHRDFLEIVRNFNLNKYAVFSPGATSDTKRWPEEKFDKLIDRFHDKYPEYKIVMSGANGDRNLIERLRKNRDYCYPLINFNLRKMSLVFKNSEVVVANDGCGIDISWVSGGKLVALAGPVDRRLHEPQKNTIVLHHKLKCYPCDWSKPCPRPWGEWCMDLITVDEVLEAVDKQIIGTSKTG